jgi:hypothetical protein
VKKRGKHYQGNLLVQLMPILLVAHCADRQSSADLGNRVRLTSVERGCRLADWLVVALQAKLRERVVSILL